MVCLVSLNSVVVAMSIEKKYYQLFVMLIEIENTLVEFDHKNR